MWHSLVRLLIFDELAGGWIEDLTESCSSSPSTDFVSESQPSGPASRISLGNTAAMDVTNKIMWHNLAPLLLLDELAGGPIEDLTESCPSTPSTDFVSESQPEVARERQEEM